MSTLLKKDLVNSSEELNEDVWLGIIDQGNKIGVKEWHICGGGEPLYFIEKAKSVMNKIKENGKHGEIITNGTMFTENMIKELVELGWDKIIFSF